MIQGRGGGEGRRADLVCLSATLTTVALRLRQSIDMVRLGNPKVRIMVGGSALSEQDACKWGADGYAPDAMSLWRVVMQQVDSVLPLNLAVEAVA